ncbi:hypothetical protein [Lewinella sp. LCG006]|uniref:hypothetical protein n=1 Tax=Lewinella sp. LCG006 TaxID=3231911 RepID=UPI0034612F93
MKNLFPLLLLVLLFSTCQDDEAVTPDPYDEELQLEIVTGINVRDVNAAPLGSYGNPNVFSGEVDFYPNPALGQANVIYFGAAGLNVKQYWIFAASVDTSYADINYNLLLDNATYSPDEVAALNVVQTNTVNQQGFALNLEGFTPGYYRIFYLMSDNTLYWDNIYVDPTASDQLNLTSELSDDF